MKRRLFHTQWLTATWVLDAESKTVAEPASGFHKVGYAPFWHNKERQLCCRNVAPWGGLWNHCLETYVRRSDNAVSRAFKPVLASN